MWVQRAQRFNVPIISNAFKMRLYSYKPIWRLTRVYKNFNLEFNRRFSTIRNVAVVAHVDHGKTTLVDGFLKCGGEEILHSRAMDRNELERERGITITSKVTRIDWNGNILNVVDTPGHADFGGEVERILNIVDCVCLLVDVVEGPKPQTGFVMRKALENPSLRTVVVVNKCDRECNKTQCEIESELFDLLVDCGASDEQLEFPILFASAKENWVSNSYPIDTCKTHDVSIILKALIQTASPPSVQNYDYFTFQVSLLDYEDGCAFITGKVNSGSVSRGSVLHIRDFSGKKKGKIVVRDVFVAKRAGRVTLMEPVKAGDIITIQCHKGVVPDINDTVGSCVEFEPLPPVKIANPVISVVISANSSPLAGSDGKFQTTAEIGKRLRHEAKMNPTLQVIETTEKDAFHLKGRGELQIGILLENMRREGYEMSVSPLSAVTTTDEDGNVVEAFQKLLVLTPAELAPGVVELLASRGVEVVSYSECKGGTEQFRTLEFHGSTTQLLGLMAPLRDLTRGRGDISMSTIDYRVKRAESSRFRNSGCLIASCAGVASAFALETAMSKGSLFIPEGTRVYEGMIIGESSTDKDIYLNVVKSKPMTGMRSKCHEQVVKIVCKVPTVEQALSFIENDEQLEITPKRIAIRKAVLSRL